LKAAVPAASPLLEDVRRWAGPFASAVVFRGGCVAALAAGRLPPVVTVRVQVRDLSALSSAMQTMPFQDVHAAGNDLTFQRGRVQYAIRCLDATGWLEEWSRPVRFAHEALMWSAAGGTILDPLRARRGGVTALRPVGQWSETTIESFEAILQGMLDAGRHGLVPTPQFEALKQNSLRRRLGSRAEAAAVAQSVTATLAPLAACASERAIVSLLHSPLVDRALAVELGRTGRAVTAEFQRLKGLWGGVYADAGACWMAAVLGERRLTAPARPDVVDSDRPAAQATRRAMARARQHLLVPISPVQH
jgi:hypothetical protein